MARVQLEKRAELTGKTVLKDLVAYNRFKIGKQRWKWLAVFAGDEDARS